MPAAVHRFQHPRLAVELSLGHKYNGWYLLFAQPYRTADSREVARLDSPGPFPRKRGGGWSHRPRFWFDLKAASGWERGEETLLDLLLSMEPPLLAVVDHEDGMSQVEVLVPESKLAHFCEGCGRWEADCDDSLRWFMVRSDVLPGYLCPPCHTKDWIGAHAARCLRRIFCGI